jgi:hypothetical protein
MTLGSKTLKPRFLRAQRFLTARKAGDASAAETQYVAKPRSK